MQNKQVQRSDSLRVCQWRSWHNERQGHLTHNHISTCAVCLALFYCDPLFLVNATCCLWMCCGQSSIHHHTCSIGFVLDFDSWKSLLSFIILCQKLIDRFQHCQSFLHYCTEPRKESSKQNLDLSNCYLWVLLQASWSLLDPNFLINFF